MNLFAFDPILIDYYIIAAGNLIVPVQFVVIRRPRQPAVVLGHLRNGRPGNRITSSFKRGPLFEALTWTVAPAVPPAPLVPVAGRVTFIF
ncbi:hypothetical protein D3C86_1918390 [compost metagenome]